MANNPGILRIQPWGAVNTLTLARQAVRLYPRTAYSDRRAVNTLRRGWIRQIRYLGDKWLLAIPVKRKEST